MRGGGHNPAGHCVCDGGLVIDLSPMRQVDVDGDARIARADGGATWLDFDAATQAFGLVTPGGVVGSTGVCGPHARRRHRPPDRAARPDLRQPRRRGARHAGRGRGPRERGRERRAPLGAARRGRQLRRGDATRVPPPPARARRRRRARLPRGGRPRRPSPLPRRRRRARRATSAARRCSTVDESLEPALCRPPCYTGSDGDPRSCATLRSAPGLVEDGVRAQTFLDQQRMFDSAVRREPALLEGPLRARAAGRADRRAARARRRAGPPPGGSPDRVPARRAEGRRRRPTGVVGFRHAAFNVSAHGGLAGRRPRRASTSSGRATRRRRSSRGRSAAAATSTTCRPTSRSSACAPRSARTRSSGSRRSRAVRPGERPAPQPEHPAAGSLIGSAISRRVAPRRLPPTPSPDPRSGAKTSIWYGCPGIGKVEVRRVVGAVDGDAAAGELDRRGVRLPSRR